MTITTVVNKVAQLKQTMKENEEEMKIKILKNEKNLKNEKEAKLKIAKDEIAILQEERKNREIKLVDCNRRIDKLINENGEIQKVSFILYTVRLYFKLTKGRATPTEY